MGKPFKQIKHKNRYQKGQYRFCYFIFMEFHTKTFPYKILLTDKMVL